MRRASGLVWEGFLEEVMAVMFSRKRKKGKVHSRHEGRGLPKVFPGWETGDGSADCEEGVSQYGGEGGGKWVGPGRAGVYHETCIVLSVCQALCKCLSRMW